MATRPGSAEALRAKQQAALAASLRDFKGARTQGQMVGGQYIAPHWSQQLGDVLTQVLSMRENNAALANAHGAEQLDQDANEADLQTWMGSRPQPQQIEMPGPQPQHLEGVPITGMQQPTEQDKLTWAAQGMKNPLAKTLASQYMQDQLIQEPVREEGRQFRAQEAAQVRLATLERQRETAAARMEELKLRLEQQGLDRESRAEAQRQALEARREMNALMAEIRREQIAASTTNAQIRAAATGNKLSDSARRELDEVSAIETGMQGAIDALDKSKDFGTGWLAGVASNAIPGGSSIVAKFRDKETNDAIQQLTYFTDAIRHERFGSALTKTEKASAATYLPNDYDDLDALKRKAKGLQDLINLNNKRLREKDASLATVPTAPAPVTPTQAPTQVERTWNPVTKRFE